MPKQATNLKLRILATMFVQREKVEAEGRWVWREERERDGERCHIYLRLTSLSTVDPSKAISTGDWVNRHLSSRDQIFLPRCQRLDRTHAHHTVSSGVWSDTWGGWPREWVRERRGRQKRTQRWGRQNCETRKSKDYCDVKERGERRGETSVKREREKEWIIVFLLTKRSLFFFQRQVVLLNCQFNSFCQQATNHLKIKKWNHLFSPFLSSSNRRHPSPPPGCLTWSEAAFRGWKCWKRGNKQRLDTFCFFKRHVFAQQMRFILLTCLANVSDTCLETLTDVGCAFSLVG